ncbi:MAG: ferredoxin-type protein NapG [Candidatus Marithrix sp.]|nr:ferredoxin-type protein NapG [Candidatus Marithrix sp.]
MTSKPNLTRRNFLAKTITTACGVGLFGTVLAFYANQSKAIPPYVIRPPGALPEEDFLGACIRCGLCVRDCPYDTLRLAELGEAIAVGTPYFIARSIPCEMCEDIPCIKICPTGALDHSLTDIDESKMGLAVLIDQETCLNFLGLRCDICYRVCPLIDEAITLEAIHNQRTNKHTMFLPVVHSDYCTGCGKCEYACVLDIAAIKIFPNKLVKGQIGQHYRLGWIEQEKAGGSLLEGIMDLPDRLPEGGL